MRSRLTLLTLGLALLAAHADAQPVARVPEDGSLQQALQRVSPGGVIDVAGGVYAAPAGGFSTRNKSLTLRARGGAEVVLDGQGTTAIFLVEDQGVATGRAVAFEGITFRDGLTTNLRRAGAVTIDAAYATFTSCVFEDNAATGSPQARGGAVQVLGGGIARFVSSRFEGNTAVQFGAAVYVIEGSQARVVWSEFTGNRTDLPGQGPGPAGAAIYVFDAAAYVTGSRFEGNRSGWLGGALYALGSFKSPSSVPSALLEVENSTFVDNRALPNPCCTVPGPPTGGAIHVEDQATVRVRDSRFLENETNWGGAIGSYRAIIDVRDSVFRGNRGLPYEGTPAAGGTFNITSGDTTAVDRPVAELHVADSFVQGRFGGTTEPTAQHGGCVFAGGDHFHLNGDAADHRAIVALRNVALVDCDAETGPEARSLGGGLHANLADVTLDHSIIVDSDALGENGVGGAMLLLGQSALHVSDSAFANNTSVERGGAIRMAGGELEIRDSLFLDNDATADDRVPGTVLTTAVDGDVGITGVVEGSTFSENAGVAIFEFDNVGGPPFNDVVYNGNAFFSTPGKEVFRNQAGGFVDHTVAGLNALVIARPGGPAFSKSDVDNTQLAGAPRVGRLVAGPSRLLANATRGESSPPTGLLGYAWTGGATAAINGVAGNLPGKTGVAEVDEDGRYRLRVAGDEVDLADVDAAGCSTEAVHCLNAERFLVEVYWRDFAGKVGEGSAVLGSPADDSGLFWFFSEDNWELLVKVLDGCRINQRYWLFAAATTNVEYTLRVTDKLSGATKSYFNPLGNAAVAVTDTGALDVCGVNAATPAPAELSVGPAPTVVLADAGKGGACSPNAGEMCLNGGRFRLEVEWRDFQGNRGSAQVVPFGSDDSGLFFFFTEDNWEMLVKVLTGCGINQHYWVFAAATTNVEYTLRVVDTQTGAAKSYSNPLGRAAVTVTDTEAFATCP